MSGPVSNLIFAKVGTIDASGPAQEVVSFVTTLGTVDDVTDGGDKRDSVIQGIVMNSWSMAAGRLSLMMKPFWSIREMVAVIGHVKDGSGSSAKSHVSEPG